MFAIQPSRRDQTLSVCTSCIGIGLTFATIIFVIGGLLGALGHSVRDELNAKVGAVASWSVALVVGVVVSAIFIVISIVFSNRVLRRDEMLPPPTSSRELTDVDLDYGL